MSSARRYRALWPRVEPRRSVAPRAGSAPARLSLRLIAELVTVIELTALAAIVMRVGWLRLADRPSAVALSVLIAIVIVRCWHVWFTAARAERDAGA
jgi:hypothetical protein